MNLCFGKEMWTEQFRPTESDSESRAQGRELCPAGSCEPGPLSRLPWGLPDRLRGRGSVVASAGARYCRPGRSTTQAVGAWTLPSPPGPRRLLPQPGLGAEGTCGLWRQWQTVGVFRSKSVSCSLCVSVSGDKPAENCPGTLILEFYVKRKDWVWWYVENGKKKYRTMYGVISFLKKV